MALALMRTSIPAALSKSVVPPTRIALLYGTSLIVSVSTLLISAVPAGIFERLTGRQQTDMTSMLVWLGAAILLTLPGLL